MEKGFVDTSIQFVDSMHVKAHANRHKNHKIELEETTKIYQEELEKEIEEDRINKNKKPLKKRRN